MPKKDRTVRGAGVSLYPKDWDVVKRVARSSGVIDHSPAIRLIIRRYEEIAEPVERYLSAAAGGVITGCEARERLHAVVDELLVERMNDGQD